MKKKINYLIVATIIVVAAGLLVYFIKTGKIRPFAAVTGPSITLVPTSGIFNVGDVFSTSIKVNSDGQTVNAVGVKLDYSPVDSVGVIRIQGNSDMFTDFSGWSVDPNSGRIYIPGRSPGQPDQIINGTFATIYFSAMKEGNTTVKVFFDAANPSTDSNIVHCEGSPCDPVDILTASGIDEGTTYSLRTPSGETPAGQTPGGTTPGSRRSPTPTCGGPKQPTCPPSTPTSAPTEQPTPELGASPTPTEIVIGPTSTPASTSTPVTGESPLPTPSVEFFTSPIAEPSASASPTTVAGFAISKTVALLLYIGVPVVVVIAIFLIWWWRKKKRTEEGTELETKEEIDDDEMI